MALNSSGPISLAGTTAGQSIEIELGGNGTTQISLNDASVRTLAGVASGAITMPTNFYGKSNRVALSYTYSANTANASLNLSAIAGYSAGKSDITVTINTGVYIYSTAVGTNGLNITGGTSGDTLTIVNNGYIMGMGGDGGTTGGGSAGGVALNFGFALSGATVTNTSGYIGGGGGGGSGYTSGASYWTGGGGGAGAGAGGSSSYAGVTSVGGTGGGIGSVGGNGDSQQAGGVESSIYVNGAGGGGRIIPGTGGGGRAGGGSGGGGGYAIEAQPGSGGSGSSAGGNGIASGAGGGGWGASGGTSGGSGGAGGKAVNLNAKSITWTGGASSSGRAYGAVS